MLTIEEKILIITDVHLAGHFDDRKFALLKRLLEKYRVVVIAGDFLDLYVAEFTEIQRTWSPLFDILKTKETYYLFGNHDARQNDIDYSLLSKYQADSLDFKQGGRLFHIEHGHRLAPYVDTSNKHFPRFLLPIGSYWDRVMTRLLGKYFLRIYKRDNERMKRWQRANLLPEVVLICGHSHWAELSPRQNYANTGLMTDGFAQYLFIEKGVIVAREQRYRV